MRIDSGIILMHKKLLTFLLHMKRLIKQMVCNHPVATGRLHLKIVNCIKKKKIVCLEIMLCHWSKSMHKRGFLMIE